MFLAQQWVLVSALLALGLLLAFYEARKGATALGVHELANLVNRDSGAVLDLRSEPEFQQGHIANAMNIPHQKLSGNIDSLKRYRELPLILVCKIGQHSGAAAKRLRDMGFKQVYRLRGGMSEWKQQQMPQVVPGKSRKRRS